MEGTQVKTKVKFLTVVTTVIVTALHILIVSAPTLAEDTERQHLFGDWGGTRTTWENNGVAIESIVTFDTISNVNGGVDEDTANLGNYDLTFTIDTEKVGLWKGGTFFTYVLGNWGNAPSELVGDLQVTDNIETTETLKLYEIWYDHNFWDGMVSVLVGLHDYNSEFDALEYAGNLLNSSFGISVDISQVGPSIFSTTSLATRIKVSPSENSYIQTAVYDGVPGDPNNEHGTHVQLDTRDGLFYALEAGIVGGETAADYYKAAIGGWYHTTDYEDFNGEFRNHNSGLYGIAEKAIWREEDPEQGLGVFLQLGFASPSRNQIGQYYGGGFAYTGLLPCRDGDVTSFGFAHARNSDDFKDSDPTAKSSETALELNYRAEITPYLAVTPDIQYVINPGTTPDLDDALVIGARFEVSM